MKKIIFLLAACFMLGTSAPLSHVVAQNSTTTVLTTDTCMQASDSVMVSELEKAEAEIARLQKTVSRLQQESNTSEDTIEDIIAIIMIFGLPIAIVFFYLFFRWKNQRAKYRLINKMLESGQENVVELYNLVINEEKQKKRNPLQHGIRLMFTGLGLFIFLIMLTGNEEISSVGLLVLFIGAGEAVAGYLKKREEKKLCQKEMPEQPTVAAAEKTQPEKTENPTPDEQ